MPDPDEIPEDDDPGHATTPADTAGNPSQGCTNNTHVPCNCIAVWGTGLHVSKIRVYCKQQGDWWGRWKVNRNGTLFVRSPVVQISEAGWVWAKGWTFNDGDVLCGGFYLTTGGWYDYGPACETIQLTGGRGADAVVRRTGDK